MPGFMKSPKAQHKVPYKSLVRARLLDAGLPMLCDEAPATNFPCPLLSAVATVAVASDRRVHALLGLDFEFLVLVLLVHVEI